MGKRWSHSPTCDAVASHLKEHRGEHKIRSDSEAQDWTTAKTTHVLSSSAKLPLSAYLAAAYHRQSSPWLGRLGSTAESAGEAYS